MRAEELEVRAGFGRVMRAEDGVALVLAMTVEADELGGNEVVAVEVNTEEDNEGVNDKNRATHLVEQPEQQTQRIILEHLDVDVGVVN